MSSSIDIYYTKFSTELPDEIFKQYLSLIPVELQDRNGRFVRWQDRHSHLFGKILLIECLSVFGYSEKDLINLHYNQYDRPYLNDQIDFNISHSGEYVVCAIAKGLKLGIDIEKIKEIEFHYFEKVMSDEQWKCINGAQNIFKEFFKYWTIKECVIKADSRGLSIPLTNIHVEGNIAVCEDNTWHLNEVMLDENYCCCLACNQPDININIHKQDFFIS